MCRNRMSSAVRSGVVAHRQVVRSGNLVWRCSVVITVVACCSGNRQVGRQARVRVTPTTAKLLLPGNHAKVQE